VALCPWRDIHDLIATGITNNGFTALADGVMAFFDHRSDLQRPGVASARGCPEAESASLPKVSTDISLVGDRPHDPGPSP